MGATFHDAENEPWLADALRAQIVHGVGSSSYLWRHVIDQLDGERRWVAVDLPLHGQTPAAADQDSRCRALARFLADCCKALGLTDVDPVANDTGGDRPGISRRTRRTAAPP